MSRFLRALLLTAVALLALGAAGASAETVHGGDAPMALGSASVVFGLLELPFLLVGVVFAFATAVALRGGVFGRGMALLAWGFLVMAIGHLHMQLAALFGINLFESVLSQTGGTIAWIVALMATWGLSGLGFYSMDRVTRAA